MALTRTILDYLDGRLSADEATALEELCQRNALAGERLRDFREIVRLLREGPVSGLSEENRCELQQAFVERSGTPRGEDLEAWFELEYDSAEEVALVGRRGAGLAERFLVFANDVLRVEIGWHPGAEGEPGTVRGQLHAVGDGVENPPSLVRIVPEGEIPRQSRCDVDGFFVVEQVPAVRRLQVTVIRGEDGEAYRLPSFDL